MRPWPGYIAAMRRLLALISLGLVLALALTSPAGGAGGHCDRHHGQAQPAGHDMDGHRASHEAPADECDHCPPTDCSSAAPCAGGVLAAPLRASAPPRDLLRGMEPRFAPPPFTTRSPEPTYPPPRLA